MQLVYHIQGLYRCWIRKVTHVYVHYYITCDITGQLLVTQQRHMLTQWYGVIAVKVGNVLTITPPNCHHSNIVHIINEIELYIKMLFLRNVLSHTQYHHSVLLYSSSEITLNEPSSFCAFSLIYTRQHDK